MECLVIGCLLSSSDTPTIKGQCKIDVKICPETVKVLYKFRGRAGLEARNGRGGRAYGGETCRPWRVLKENPFNPVSGTGQALSLSKGRRLYSWFDWLTTNGVLMRL